MAVYGHLSPSLIARLRTSEMAPMMAAPAVKEAEVRT